MNKQLIYEDIDLKIFLERQKEKDIIYVEDSTGNVERFIRYTPDEKFQKLINQKAAENVYELPIEINKMDIIYPKVLTKNIFKNLFGIKVRDPYIAKYKNIYLYGAKTNNIDNLIIYIDDNQIDPYQRFIINATIPYFIDFIAREIIKSSKNITKFEKIKERLLRKFREKGYKL